MRKFSSCSCYGAGFEDEKERRSDIPCNLTLASNVQEKSGRRVDVEVVMTARRERVNDEAKNLGRLNFEVLVASCTMSFPARRQVNVT